MKQPIIISPDSPFYKGLESCLGFDNEKNSLELLPLLEKVGYKFPSSYRDRYPSLFYDLAFELHIQGQIEFQKFHNVEIEVDYSNYHKLIPKLKLMSSGVVNYEDFLKISTRSDTVKKRLYMIPIRGVNRIHEIKKFIEGMGYIFSGVPELISYLYFMQKNHEENNHETYISSPSGFASWSYTPKRANSMMIVELRDTMQRGKLARAVVCAENLHGIKTRGIGGGFTNHYVICEKA